MPADTRARLAQRQSELIRALSGVAASPAGFDPLGVSRSAASLRQKRLHTVRRCWPRLVEELGDPTFRSLFAEYARSNALVQELPLHDGAEFVVWLRKRGAFPHAAWAEWLGYRAQYAWKNEQWRARRGMWIGIAWSQGERRLGLVWRWPGGAVRCRSFSLRFRRP